MTNILIQIEVLIPKLIAEDQLQSDLASLNDAIADVVTGYAQDNEGHGQIRTMVLQGTTEDQEHVESSANGGDEEWATVVIDPERP